MYNLLIVDDEPLITDSLYDLFAARADADFNVLKAYSGREALGWMEKTRVDVLLTDISMPDINGLDVHRRVAALWPECVVIYLTSFSDFEYVQQAIRNNGEDYILKTEGDEIVVQAVDRAMATLDSRRKSRMLIEEARDSLSMALPLLQSEFIADLAEAVGEAGPDELDAQLAELKIPLSGRRPVLMVLGRAESWPEGLSPMEKIKRAHRVRGIIENFFADAATAACALHERSTCVLLLQPGSRQQAAPAQDDAHAYKALALRVSASLDTLQGLCRDSSGISLSFAASGNPIPWGKIGGLYEALRLRLHEGGAGLLYFDQGVSESPDSPPQGAPDYTEFKARMLRLGLLKSHLEIGDRKGFMGLYDSLMASIGSGSGFSEEMQAEAYYRMAAILTEYASKWSGVGPDGAAPGIGMPDSRESHAGWDDSVAYLRTLAGRMFDKRNSDTKKNASRIFAFIRDYTQSNIGGDLSLTKFAALLNFHPFYLSKLFKQISGKTLSDYVSEAKLARAKELLGGTQQKVSEISSALGFMTSSYFTSFFRKHTNLSPVEYRNSIGWNELK